MHLRNLAKIDEELRLIFQSSQIEKKYAKNINIHSKMVFAIYGTFNTIIVQNIMIMDFCFSRAIWKHIYNFLSSHIKNNITFKFKKSSK